MWKLLNALRLGALVMGTVVSLAACVTDNSATTASVKAWGVETPLPVVTAYESDSSLLQACRQWFDNRTYRTMMFNREIEYTFKVTGLRENPFGGTRCVVDYVGIWVHHIQRLHDYSGTVNFRHAGYADASHSDDATSWTLYPDKDGTLALKTVYRCTDETSGTCLFQAKFVPIDKSASVK